MFGAFLRASTTIQEVSSLTTCITLFSHVDQFDDLEICQLYYGGAPNKARICVYYSYFKLTLGNLDGVILLALLTGIIVHYNTIILVLFNKKYYS